MASTSPAATRRPEPNNARSSSAALSAAHDCTRNGPVLPRRAALVNRARHRPGIEPGFAAMRTFGRRWPPAPPVPRSRAPAELPASSCGSFIRPREYAMSSASRVSTLRPPGGRGVAPVFVFFEDVGGAFIGGGVMFFVFGLRGVVKGATPLPLPAPSFQVLRCVGGATGLVMFMALWLPVLHGVPSALARCWILVVGSCRPLGICVPREQGALYRRRVWHRRVERAEDADRRVERLEGFFLDDRGEALADAAGPRVLVDDQHAAAVPGDASTASRSSGASERRSSTPASMPSAARRSATRSATCGRTRRRRSSRGRSPARRSAALPIGTGGGASSEPLLDPRIAIERDVLVIEHGIRIGDGAGHQRARVGGVEGTTIFSPGVR